MRLRLPVKENRVRERVRGMTATPTDAPGVDGSDGRRDTEDPRRRGRSARAEVAFFFIGISLLSVVALSVFNFFAARELINGLVETSLVEIGSTRAARIENGVQRPARIHGNRWQQTWV